MVTADDVPPASPDDRATFPLVAIGASAGGLPAISTLLAALSPAVPAALVVITHVAPDVESQLVELLRAATALPVRWIDHGAAAERGVVQVLPPGHDLSIDNGRLLLVPREDAPVHRPIDRFLTDLAKAQGARSLAVILSGTGSDGSRGLRDMHAAGGMIIVQTPHTAEYDGMPASAIQTGLVDAVLPIASIGPYLTGILAHFDQSSFNPPDTPLLERILAALLDHTGHDFSGYKPSTLLRRLHKRMLLTRTANPAVYAALLESDPEERSRLFHDLLIGVTAFFRDPQAFAALEQALPSLLAQRPGEDFRVWVAGCSTGEEAYSVAMLLCDQIKEGNVQRPLKIFATDIDETALERARQGAYASCLAEDVGQPRLGAYFRREASLCLIQPHLRDHIVFAHHDLLRDPPFLGLDLVVCRNFLIYLTPELQSKAISIFSHSLQPNGLLLLGSSETIGPQGALFETISKKWRLFRRKTVPASLPTNLYAHFARLRRDTALPPWSRPTNEPPDPEGLAEAVLLQRYAPPAVLVDTEGRVVRLSGDTTPFLLLPQGTPTLSIHKLVHKLLRPGLREALAAAQKDNAEHVSGPLGLTPDATTLFTVRVSPIPDASGHPAFFLIVFEPHGRQPSPTPPAVAAPETQELILGYESELERISDQLQRAVEGYETLNEELKASNEELLSMNEELQSSNEEMDASREELQSLNEELSTVNAELQAKVEELAEAKSFAENLLAATNLATVGLDETLRIVRFTPAAQALFHLVPTDLRRPVEQIKARFPAEQLPSDCRQALAGDIVERELLTEDGSWFLQRAYPSHDAGGGTVGLVLTFVDVTTLKNAEKVLARSNEELEALVAKRTEELQEKLRLLDLANVVVRDMDARITLWNTGAEQLYGFTREEALGQVSYRLLRTDFPEPYANILETLIRQGRWSGELRKRTKDGREIQVATLWLLNRDAAGRPASILEVGNDVTERNRLEEQARRWVRVFESAAFGLAHARTADNTFLEVNDAFARQRGYEPSELLGRSLLDLFVPELRPRTAKKLLDIDRIGHGVFETEHLRKDGSRFPVLMEVTTLRDAAGQAVSRVAYALDITARKKIEQEVRDMARFPSENPYPVLRVGRDMRVSHANKAAERFLAFLDSGPGRPWPARFQPELAVVMETGRLDTFEVEIADRTFALAASPVTERGYVNLYGMDVTERKQTELALAASEAIVRKNEALLRTVVDTAPDAIIIQDRQRFAYLNPAGMRLFGISDPSEIIGRLILDFIHPADRELVRERIRQSNEEGLFLPATTITYLRRDGSSIMVEAVSAPFEHQGHPGSLVFARDISDRLHAAEERRRSQELSEAVARVRDAYIVNRASADIFDTALTEVLRLSGSQYGFIAELRTDEQGRAYQQCLAISDIAWDQATRDFYASHAPGGLVFYAMDGLNAAALSSGQPVVANDAAHDPRRSGRLPAGHPPLHTFVGLPLFHGNECLGSLGLANRADGYDEATVARLRPLAEVCAQIIERLRAERRLVDAKQAAEAASLAKSEFLANMSHEIRTPLNGILGMLQLLQTTVLDGEQAEYAANAITASRRLTRLLSDILDLSLVESGKLRIQVAPCSPRDLRESVLDLFAHPARSKGLNLTFALDAALPESILADEVRLRQILFNLVGNAVKFTDQGSVTVSMGPASRNHDAAFRLLLTVADTGIGIADDKLAPIFEPFGQVEGVFVRRFGGAGLGLSIVRRLVRLMGGEIAVASQEGQGTTFCIALPLPPDSRPATIAAPATPTETPAGRLRLLLAEDDAVSMLSFRRMLEKDGYQVDVAENGEQVLAMVAAGPYDCILMDVQMPVMDGVAATRAIRTRPDLRRQAAIPVIAMTAYAMAGDREKFLAAGMNGYVGKPVDMEELRQAIRQALAAAPTDS